MPGGGAAYGRPPRDMGAAELTVETILRTIATLTIGLLFGSLALNADLDSKVRVETRGGALEIEWPGRDKDVLMTGPAIAVFEGVWRASDR